MDTKKIGLPIALCFMSLAVSRLAQAQTNLSSLIWGLDNQGRTQQLAIDHYTNGNILGINGEDIRLPPDASQTRKVIVGILDTGADFTHPQLKNILIDKGYNAINNSLDATDAHGHGTHVAGIIGAEGNSTGFHGVSKNVRVLAVKVIQSGPNAPIRPQDTQPGAGTALTENVAKGLMYAIDHGAEVINLSMAWPASIRSAKVDAAMKHAGEKNVIIVSSAGNDGTTANVYPCIYEEVICVGAQGPDGAAAHFSNYGSMVDLLAPGTAILSTWPMSKQPVTYAGQVGYEFRNGTSMSAPFVTGALAELLSRGFTPSEAKSRLLLGTRKSGTKKLFSTDIVGTYTEDHSNEVKNFRFGNLDLSGALAVKPCPLILPVQKGLIEVLWDGASTEVSVPVEWKNRWITAGETTINLNGQSFTFSGIDSQASVVTPITVALVKNPDSIIHLSGNVMSGDYQKSGIEITLHLIRALKANALPVEARVQTISGINPKDYSDIRSVVSSDQNPRSDIILSRDSNGGIEIALIQDTSFASSVLIKNFKLDQFLKFFRLGDQSYAAIFTKPDPKVTRPDFFIEYFDAKLKFTREAVLGTETTVLPENFHWAPNQSVYSPLFISLGFTPPLDLPKYDPWNPSFQDIKTQRLYYLVGSDLHIVHLANNQFPLQILSDGRVLISEGNSYFQTYKVITLKDGAIAKSETYPLAQYRMLIGLDAGTSVLNLSGEASESSAISGASTAGNLRVTTVGKQAFDQVLSRSTILDALMNVSGVYADPDKQYYLVQSHYDMVFMTSGSTQTLSTSLNRYSYIPSMNFARSFYPTLVQSPDGKAIPGMYIPASVANAGTSEVIVADPVEQKLSRPARFHLQVRDPDCSELGNLIPATATSPAQQVFVCGNQLVHFPLKL